MYKILAFIFVLTILQAIRGGMEPDPPALRYTDTPITCDPDFNNPNPNCVDTDY